MHKESFERSLFYAYLSYAEGISEGNELQVKRVLDFLKKISSYEVEDKNIDAGGYTESPFEEEIYDLLRKNIGQERIVLPELELLYSQIAGTNFMVAYSDENGLVLDTIYDKTCLQTDVGKTVIPGSIWAEKVCGCGESFKIT